jgi:hypothetical protein
MVPNPIQSIFKYARTESKTSSACSQDILATPGEKRLVPSYLLIEILAETI